MTVFVLASALATWSQTVRQRYALRSGHEEAEGHSLRIAVRKLLVGRFWKKQLAPVRGQAG
jgi:hypothetical protein